MEPVTFRYSKTMGSYYVILLTGLLAFITINSARYAGGPNFTGILVITAIFDLLVLLMLLYVVIKSFIPAMQGKTALEVNSKGMVYSVKRIAIDWKDVSSIRYGSMRYTSFLNIIFKYKTEHGSSFRIPLTFIEGKSDDIAETVNKFYNNAGG